MGKATAIASQTFEGPADLYRRIGRASVLSETESIALECLKQIASEGRRATQAELCAATGIDYQYGTLPAILNRLADKGYIERKFYQRGLHVKIVETGEWTAPPACMSPHWRHRTEQPPTPPIQLVRQKAQPLAVLIEQEARRLGKPMSEFLADLVYIGFHEYQREQEERAAA